ncbi:MAG: hypothetical protein IPN59_12540 [Holophaga sp.]|nr:hypothetical protein [Holophaga sp.]
MRKVLAILGWLNLLVGVCAGLRVIGGLSLWNGTMVLESEAKPFIPYIYIGLGSAVFLLAFSEALELLERIANQTKPQSLTSQLNEEATGEPA